jgi:hypothetical protein
MNYADGNPLGTLIWRHKPRLTEPAPSSISAGQDELVDASLDPTSLLSVAQDNAPA